MAEFLVSGEAWNGMEKELVYLSQEHISLSKEHERSELGEG